MSDYLANSEKWAAPPGCHYSVGPCEPDSATPQGGINSAEVLLLKSDDDES